MWRKKIGRAKEVHTKGGGGEKGDFKRNEKQHMGGNPKNRGRIKNNTKGKGGDANKII